MFDSKFTDYDIVDATPFGRDPIKELAAACQRHGIKPRASTTRRPRTGTTPTATATTGTYDEPSKDFAGYVESYVKPQVRELLTNYGPIGLIWFDTPPA